MDGGEQEEGFGFVNAGKGSGLKEEEAFCLSALRLPQSPASSSLQPVSSSTRNSKICPFTLCSSPSPSHHPFLYYFLLLLSRAIHPSIHPSAPSDRALLTAVLESLRPWVRQRPRPAGNRAEGRGTGKTQCGCAAAPLHAWVWHSSGPPLNHHATLDVMPMSPI